ncbi:hypothetical protein [Kineococcus rhizosphaerae]|uniref:Uncharacterized protein n=1 Tax=Kineococcus rhizosphaerae TaxID=559628 RepID=A0A2T0R2V2_9ACTN|nr:hypothetical protein [Kineococcus rhizosphaerae]PRY14138.1 hypothetical protein CLV37_107257 [Kineococcus rhizosphaerae]
MHEASSQHPVGTPSALRRPTSKNKWVDLVLDAVFSFTGPAQVTHEEGPQRGPRTDEEATAGYGEWDRVVVDGHSYLVPRRTSES